MNIEEKIKEYETNPEIGLLSGMAEIRLNKYGNNNFWTVKTKNNFKIFNDSLFHQFNLFVIIFYLLGFFFVLERDIINFSKYTFLFIFISITVSFYTYKKFDIKIRNRLNEFKLFSRVLRDGKVRKIPVEDVVPGDILILNKGDIVPADSLIIEANDFQINSRFYNAGEIVKKYQIVKSGYARAMILKNNKNSENIILKKTDFNVNLYQYITKIELLLLLFIVLAGIIIFIIKSKIFYTVFIFAANLLFPLNVFILDSLTKFTDNLAKLKVVINNLSFAFNRNFYNENLIIIDEIERMLVPEFKISKIYANGRLIDVVGEYNRDEGEFYLRSLNILKSPKFKEIEEELEKKYNLHLFNRRNPNPYKKFKKIDILKNEILCNSIIAGKLTSSGEIEKSISGEIFYDGNPVDFAFHSLFEKSKIKNFNYKLLKKGRIDFYDFIIIKDENNKIFIYIKSPAHLILDRILFAYEGDKKIPLSTKKIEHINEIIKSFAKNSYRVYATAFQELSEKELKNINLDSPLKDLKYLTLLAIFGISVKPDENFLKLLEKLKNFVIISYENKIFIEQLLKNINLKHDEIITKKEFLKLDEVNYLNKIKQLKVYAEFDIETKHKIINDFLKYKKSVILFTDELNEFKNCIKILDGRFISEKDKIKADLIITKEISTNFENFLNLFEKFKKRVKNIILAKQNLVCLRILTFFAYLFINSTKFQLDNLIIFSLLLELLIFIFYKRIELKDIKITHPFIQTIILIPAILFLQQKFNIYLILIIFLTNFIMNSEIFLTGFIKILVISLIFSSPAYFLKFKFLRLPDYIIIFAYLLFTGILNKLVYQFSIFKKLRYY